MIVDGQLIFLTGESMVNTLTLSPLWADKHGIQTPHLLIMHPATWLPDLDQIQGGWTIGTPLLLHFTKHFLTAHGRWPMLLHRFTFEVITFTTFPDTFTGYIWCIWSWQATINSNAQHSISVCWLDLDMISICAIAVSRRGKTTLKFIRALSVHTYFEAAITKLRRRLV